MGLVHNWSRSLPERCTIHYVKLENEWIILGLYCSDSLEELSINAINGRFQKRKTAELELRGTSEFRKNFYILTCYRGLNRKLWTRVERSLNSKIECRQNACVVASLMEDRVLEVKIIDSRGEEQEVVKIPNTFDFQVGSSLNAISITTTGFRQEDSATLIVDPAAMSVAEYLNGFGGHVQASTDYLFVYGISKGKYVTKVYSSYGEEVCEVDGAPTLMPFNPLIHRTHRDKLFESKLIGVIDKNEVRALDSRDFSIVFSCIKPPFTRGLLDIDIENQEVTVYSAFMNRPLIVKYSSSGAVKLISCEVPGFRYGLMSNKLFAIYTERAVGETRVYRVVGSTLLHEDSFGPSVFPLLVRGNTLVLTDSLRVSSYTME